MDENNLPLIDACMTTYEFPDGAYDSKSVTAYGRACYEAGRQQGGRDAERYRWLRDAHPTDREGLWVARGLPMTGLSCWRNEELDAAIDAQQGKGGAV